MKRDPFRNFNANRPLPLGQRGLTEIPAKVEGCVYQTDVRERLRKIAQHTFADRIIFFGEEPDIISNIQQAVKNADCIFVAPLQHIFVCQPESAGEKLALAGRHTIDVRRPLKK